MNVKRKKRTSQLFQLQNFFPTLDETGPVGRSGNEENATVKVISRVSSHILGFSHIILHHPHLMNFRYAGICNIRWLSAGDDYETVEKHNLDLDIWLGYGKKWFGYV